MTSLQTQIKWNETRRNFKVNDIVLLMDRHSRNQWPMALVVLTEQDENGMVWSVMLKLGNDKSRETLIRPISKLVLLIGDNENWISKKVWFAGKGAFLRREC